MQSLVRLRVLCVLCGYFLSVAELAGAAEPQIVVPMKGEAFAGELVSVGADGRVTFRVMAPKTPPAEAGSPTRALKLEELVRWGNPVEARAQTIVVLADGGRIVTAADWSGGAAVRLDGDVVVVRGDMFDEVRLPRALVRGVVFAQRRHPRERERLVERVQTGDHPPAEAGSPDVVLLTNDDRLEGKVTELAGGSLTMTTKGGAAKLPLSRVEAVVLGSRQLSVVSRQSKVVVGLHDGSLVYADAVRADEKELELDVAGGLKLEGGSVEDIVALQSLGGPFVYLSDLDAADYRHVPYLSIEWPYERDRNVLGEPLVVDGKRYVKGIGMHSAGRLTYGLDGKYRRFDAAVAVDDSAGERGSVTFGAYVLRDGGWQEAYKSGIVRGGDSPQPVSVDVSGAQGLTLTVDFADRGDELDHAAWLDARLVK